MRHLAIFAVIGMTALVSSPLLAAVNGKNDIGDGYGSPHAIQDTPTGFGDNLSELNAAFAALDAAGNLSLLLTGNLEGNGNALVIFIDSRAGGGIASHLGDGSGVLGSVGGARTDDWGTDIDGDLGVNPTPGGGSILDPGFDPDVAIEINIGGVYYTNVIDLTISNVPDFDKDIYLGQHNLGSTSATQPYMRSDLDTARGHGGMIEHAFDNSNVAGVLGYDFGAAPGPLGDPLTATTGYEARFSAEFLANDGQPIRIMAFITNGDGGHVSNQFLGEAGLGGGINPGGPGDFGGLPLFDARLYVGNQFFTVVPEPQTSVLALGLFGLRFRRRHKQENAIHVRRSFCQR
jgi:hypothetical protein